MSAIELTGRLICEDDEGAATVGDCLPRHFEFTRAEAGCLHFEVVQTEDPLVWSVAERFADQPVCDARNESGRVLRVVGEGQSLVLTNRGIPVGRTV